MSENGQLGLGHAQDLVRASGLAVPHGGATSGAFPPIADYAFLADCEVGALVAPSGSVEWLCAPQFDSPSVFTALLDRDAGRFRLGPADVTVPASRRYLPGTKVLETTWMTRTGWLVAYEWMQRTANFWREWLNQGTFPDHRWRSYLERSAMTLKGLSFSPTGAVIAAPTTSLPREPGGGRNWDSRYTFLRDASFTLWAMYSLGFDWEADDFFYFLADQADDDGSLRNLYPVGGEHPPEEKVLEDLGGYDVARAVRIGYAAYDD